MKGKILGAGAISGEDGVRYYHDEKELKNLKEGQKLEGCEVDFDIKDGKAVGIYIIKGGGFNADFSKVGSNVSASLEKVNLPKIDSKHIFWDLNEAKASLLRPNIHSVKFWLLVIVVINLIQMLAAETGSSGAGQFGRFFWLFGILTLVLLFWTSFCISTLSKPYTLLKFAAIAYVSSLVFVWALNDAIASYAVSLEWAVQSKNIPYFKILLTIVFGLVALVYGFKWFKLLSQIIGQKPYLWSFCLIIVANVFVYMIGNVAMLAAYNNSNPFKAMETFITLSNYTEFAAAALFAWATLRFREIKQID